MPKRNLFKTLALTLSAAGMASALPFQFVYGGNSYGTMDLSVSNASTVQVQFTAAGSVPGLTSFQVTGFAFAVTEGLTLSITNPGDAAFANDNNSLDWLKLTNMNAIPTSANTGIQKDVWDFGVTEGQANNFNPEGIFPGAMDVFYLTGFSGLVDDASIAANITLEGIRIQAIQPGGGSLFLTGSTVPETPAVPEPSTMAMLGLGLAGLGFAARRKRK